MTISRALPLPHLLGHLVWLMRPGRINQTEYPGRWGRVVESERESEYGSTTVVLPYVGH